ncbi:hypothetical protein GCM10027435_27430 [Haloparvum alkalitolerans]
MDAASGRRRLKGVFETAADRPRSANGRVHGGAVAAEGYSTPTGSLSPAVRKYASVTNASTMSSFAFVDMDDGSAPTG